MKVNELKKYIADLNNSINSEKDFTEIKNLILQFDGVFQGYTDEIVFDKEKIFTLNSILQNFWIWVVNNLPYEKWQNGSEVKPWLAMQRLLARENLLDADTRYFLLYQKLNKISRILESRVHDEKKSQEIINLISRFTGELKYTNKFEPKMVYIKSILHDFWSWVFNNLSYDKWQNGPEIAPWLALEQLLIKEDLLETDFHYLILFDKLRNHYDSFNSPLEISKLLPLFITCSRMLGYADSKDLDDYPRSKLVKMISISIKNPQESIKLNAIMVLLRSIFYLLNHYCTPEQLALLPQLIYCRHRTTNEERHSESAILNYLIQKPKECLQFFSANEKYFCIKAFNDINSLQAISHLIPRTRTELIKGTCETHWIYPFIQQVRLSSIEKEKDRLSVVLSLLEADFATQKDLSYLAALDFAKTIKMHLYFLTQEEAKLVKDAHEAFCLNHYIKQRTKDPEDKHSILSFSKGTKLGAARKRQLKIGGAPVYYSFFETLALKQGDLKKILESNRESKLTAFAVI